VESFLKPPWPVFYPRWHRVQQPGRLLAEHVEMTALVVHPLNPLQFLALEHRQAKYDQWR
jgi:hypothetical protein